MRASGNDKQQFGFFSRSGSNAEISHVGLVDINIGFKHTHSSSGYIASVGGLIGTNFGTINNSYTTGNVFGQSNHNQMIVGGLTGSNFGTTTQLPRVKYAPTATYCTDDTYTTQQTCEDALESWVIEGCGGDTGVTCGDVIPGQ